MCYNILLQWRTLEGLSMDIQLVLMGILAASICLAYLAYKKMRRSWSRFNLMTVGGILVCIDLLAIAVDVIINGKWLAAICLILLAFRIFIFGVVYLVEEGNDLTSLESA